MNDAGLSALLPTPEQTLLLRSGLHDAPVSGEAWDRWCRHATRDGTPIRRALAPAGDLLALLAWNLRRCRVPLDREVATHLRAAYVTEELRLRTYQQVCASAFRVLATGGVPFIVLKGAALASVAYPEPGLRHADDIDLLLHEHDLEPAARLLLQHEWRASGLPVLPNPLHARPLVHPSGVPVELHRRLLIPYYTLPYGDLWARGAPAALAGADVRVLSPADSLLHIVAHGMSGFAMLRWVADAWFILQRHPHLDWSVFLSTACAGRLHLPLLVACRYLTEQMAMPMPAHVLDDLSRGARRTSYLGRRAAQPWPAGSLASIWSSPLPWWRRLALLWRRALPSPVRFALQYDLGMWAVPVCYVSRLIRHARSGAFGNRQRGRVAAPGRWGR